MQKALTLVELLIALAILVTVTASTTLIFRSIGRAWGTGQLRTERYQQARLLFDLFTRELSSCVSSPRYPLIGHAAGEPHRIEKQGTGDELFFVGTLPGRSGLIERGYWLTPAGELMCHDDESGDADYTTGASELCGRDIASFAATYFDGNAWQKSWDGSAQSQAGSLPKAVRIRLSIGRNKPESFEAVIYVPTS